MTSARRRGRLCYRFAVVSTLARSVSEGSLPPSLTLRASVETAAKPFAPQVLILLAVARARPPRSFPALPPRPGQRSPGREELDATIGKARLQLPGQGRQVGSQCRGRRFQGRQLLTSKRIVDGTAVVGVDQTEVPEFHPLVEVGHPGAGTLEQHL